MPMRSGSMIALGAAALLWFGCADGGAGGDGGAVACAGDDDCPAGQYCAEGVCAPAADCETDADCPAGQRCNRVTGRCVPGPDGAADGGDGAADGGADGADGAADAGDGAADAGDGVDAGDGGPDAGPDGGERLCTPGVRRCVEQATIEVCVDGERWELAERCDTELDQHCEWPGVRCMNACQASLPAASNLGCVFWPLKLANYGNEGWDAGSDDHRWGAGVRLFVANPSQQTAALSLSDSQQQFDLGAAAELLPGASTVIRLPEVAAGGLADIHVVDGGRIGYAAYRLRSSQPVFAYQFNPVQLAIASSDASLLLPQRTLGKYYQVLTVPHSTKTIGEQTFHHPAGFAVVATRDQTRVEVRVTAATAPMQVAAHDEEAAAEGHALEPLAAGEQREYTLNAYEVLVFETARPPACTEVKDPVEPHGTICIRADNFASGLLCNVYGRLFCQPGADLSGSRVVADKSVAVFGQAKNAMVPYFMFGTEHLEEQLPPIETWGRTFLLSRLEPRYRYYTCSRGNGLGSHESTCPFGSGESFWRVVAAEDDTRLEVLTPVDAITIEEAPRDYNYHNQVDWLTAPGEWPDIAGQPCSDDGDGFCRAQHTLDAGQVLEFGDVFNHALLADKAVMVQRLIPSEEYVGVPGLVTPDAYIELLWFKGGDPAMSTQVPSDQFRSDYAVYVVGELRYGYLSLVARQGDRIAIDQGTADEVLLDTADGSWEPLGSGFVTRRYEIHNLSSRDRPRELPGAGPADVLEGGGVHTLTGLDGAVFGVEVYGFDHYVSYGYPGGLSLENTNSGYMPGD
jgi:hypothetical protein